RMSCRSRLASGVSTKSRFTGGWFSRGGAPRSFLEVRRTPHRHPAARRTPLGVRLVPTSPSALETLHRARAPVVPAGAVPRAPLHSLFGNGRNSLGPEGTRRAPV